jgi:hypothetical protein
MGQTKVRKVKGEKKGLEGNGEVDQKVARSDLFRKCNLNSWLLQFRS